MKRFDPMKAIQRSVLSAVAAALLFGLGGFECAQAAEVSAGDRGIVIKCCGLDGFCCVEEGKDVFVGSPDINPFKDFLETTLSYLGFK